MDGRRALAQFECKLLHNASFPQANRRVISWLFYDDIAEVHLLQILIAFDIRPPMANRAALLISCSKEEDRTIHERASLEHRGISSYVLNILMRSVDFEEKLLATSPGVHSLRRVLTKIPIRPQSPRTTMLLRCSAEESDRIRRAATSRGTTISGFVLYSLRRSWNIADHALEALASRDK